MWLDKMAREPFRSLTAHAGAYAAVFGLVLAVSPFRFLWRRVRVSGFADGSCCAGAVAVDGAGELPSFWLCAWVRLGIKD
jgi:hypothetical protein